MRKLELLLLVMLAGLLLLLIGIGAYVSLQTQEITEKELNQSVTTRRITNQTPYDTEDKTNSENPKLSEIQKDHFNYYIIIGSFKTLAQAQKYADIKSRSLNIKIDILPPVKDDYYRISCGKFPALKEAEANLSHIQASIINDAWILTVK